MRGGRRRGTNPGEGASADVLVITPWFGTSAGGVETHVAETSRRLVARGLRVGVLCCDRHHDAAAHEIVDAVDIRRTRSWPRGSDLGLAPGLILALWRARPRFVHVQGAHTLVAPLAMAVAIARRLPFAVTFHTGGHSDGWRNRIRRLQWAALRPLLRRATALIAVSAFEQRYFADVLGIPAEEIVMVPNGVEFERPYARAQAPDHVRKVVSVGRLERYKGHHHLIAAWPEVTRRWPGARLQIIGSGPMADELSALARRVTSQPGAIEFASFGPGQRSAYFEALGAADVLVLLSEYESQGIVVLEALAAGMGVVVWNRTALAEFVEAGSAVGVDDPTNAVEVAESVVSAGASVGAEHRVPTWETCTNLLAERVYSLPTPC